MIYSEAPHQPVTRVFLHELERRIGTSSIVKRPVQPDKFETSKVYVMESHPAVSLGFWALDGAFGEQFFVARYKGSLRGPKYAGLTNEAKKELIDSRFETLIGKIDGLAMEQHSISFTESFVNADDDCVDASVCLLNLLDLAKGKGDWFGTSESGYFLTPKLKLLDGLRFSDLWMEAEHRQITGRNQ